MAKAKPIVFTRLSDGSLLQRQLDGSFRPVADASDHQRLKQLTETQIEKIASSDPDHPALDNTFWEGVEQLSHKEAISIKLDRDVLAFFRSQGRGYQTRINAVLRRYVQFQRKAG